MRAAGHDLRQPLQTLAILLDIQRRQATLPVHDAMVQRQDAALASMRLLLDAFIDTVRIREGSLVARLGPVALTTLGTPFMAELAEQAARRGARLRVRLPRATVRTDPRLLERWLAILVEHFVTTVAPDQLLVGFRRRGRFVRAELWVPGATERFEPVADALAGAAPHPWPGLGIAAAQAYAAVLGSSLALHRVGGQVMCSLRLALAGQAGDELPAAGAHEAPPSVVVNKRRSHGHGGKSSKCGK